MNIIEVKDLKKNYKDVQAVKGITFNVEEGSFFAFLGVNGAGKSTTINILCTVLEKTSGSVMIGGYDLSTEADKIKNIIGILFQEHVLDDVLTVKQNLETRAVYYGYSKKEIKEIIKNLSEMLELQDILNSRYGSLSGGQKRRVDIARALVNKPKILFLDEPTTGLDPQTRIKVWEIINKLRKENKLTVFLTTHYMEETAECDNVVILDGGLIVCHDSPHNLKTKFAKNKFIWYAEKTFENDNLLTQNNLSFEYINESYKVTFSNNEDITGFIYKNNKVINDYEIIKGNMDDVFLSVTGKKLGD